LRYRAGGLKNYNFLDKVEFLDKVVKNMKFLAIKKLVLFKGEV